MCKAIGLANLHITQKTRRAQKLAKIQRNFAHKMKRTNGPFSGRVVKRSKIPLKVPKRSSSVRIPKSITPYGSNFVPEQMRVRLNYVDWNLLLPLPVPGGGYTFTYSANSCYDPNVTSTGHQPLGFDNMMALYNHFVVVRSWITVTLGTTDAGVYSVVLTQDDDTTVAGSLSFAQEQPKSTFKMFQAASGPVSVSQSFDAAKNFGEAFMNQSSLIGNASANPTEQSFYHISINNQGVSMTATNCYANVSIWYDVIFSESRTIDPS